MATLPLSGMSSETANRFEVDVLSVMDIDEESGVLRPVKNSKILMSSAPSGTQSIAYLPNGTNENHFVALDTPYSTRWNRYVIDTRVVSGKTVWRAHTLSGTNTLVAEYFSLPTPTIRRISAVRPQVARIIPATNYHTTNIGSNNYQPTISYSSGDQKYRFLTSGPLPSNDTTAVSTIDIVPRANLSEYGSVIIPKLRIKGLSGHTFDNLYFTIESLGTETTAPILSYGSRRIEPRRIENTQAPYSIIEYTDIELDISGAPRTDAGAIRLYWVVIGGSSPSLPQWEIEFEFNADITSLESPPPPAFACGGLFQSAFYGFTTAIRQRDTRNEFRELTNQSPNASVSTQALGQPKKYFSLEAIVRMPTQFVLNLAQNPPTSTTVYELVLGLTSGSSWQEIATVPFSVPHAEAASAFGPGANITVNLYRPGTTTPYDYRTGKTPPDLARCLVVHGSNYEVVELKRDVPSTVINRYIIVNRGLESTTAQSFPAGAKFYFLDTMFALNRMQTIRGWISGGELPFGPIITAYDRIVCADIATGWMRFSTKNHPLMFPSLALVPGDGFAQPMPDIIYEMALEGNSLIAYGQQNAYSLIVPDRQTQTMPIGIASPKPRGYQCTSYGYLITNDGVVSRESVVFPAKYNDPTKRSKILFTGSRIYWFYGNRIYWSDPNEKGVYRHTLPDVQEILDMDVFQEDAVVLVRLNSGQLQVHRLRAGTGRVPGGSIEYGWVGEAKRAQIERIHVWGRDLNIHFITPNGTTTRTLSGEGLLSIDVHAPGRKLTQSFQLKVEFPNANSYLERILVEPLVSPFPSGSNT